MDLNLNPKSGLPGSQIRKMWRGGFKGSRLRLHGANLALLAVCSSLFAGEVQTNPLPPPAAITVDFGRDIQPILETSCLRCHGPEKSKSHFRLDNRESALSGGDNNTNDIVPGDGRKSWLIHYVAREVPELEMPPVDKGTPLTADQIGLLRAWIDQGAIWDATNQAPLVFNAATTSRWVGVQGDRAKFRELEGMKEGWGGGVNDLLISQQTSPNEKFLVEAHALVPDQDFRMKLALDETDRGFVHAGFEEWRKYYDNVGGYAPSVIPPQFTLDRDLYLNNGRAWVDFGLNLPQWPAIVLGYEYQFKQGTKSMLDWGQENGVNLNIAPSTKAIDENTHIIKLDVTHDFNDWHLEDNARVEFYSENNRSDETNTIQALGSTETKDQYNQIQGMNTLTLQKQLQDWWFLSGGAYYSKLEGGDFFHQTNNGPFAYSLDSQKITLRRESEIFSVASLFTPLEYLSISAGTQNEWTHEEGFGNAPDLEFGYPSEYENASLDEFKASQDASLRFTKIPFTVLFADTRFDEDTIGEFQQQAPDGTLANQTDYANYRYDLRGGFNTSPWRWMALNAEYRWQSSDTDYNHLLDVWGLGLNSPTNGYPDFILGRAIHDHTFETKLTLRPVLWLKTTFTYQLANTEYSTTTDPAVDAGTLSPVSPGGAILAGKNNAQTFGFDATVTPVRGLYLSGAFTYTQSSLTTANNGDPSIVPYTGGVYSAITSATYSLSPKTGLQVAYNFSESTYGQNNTAGVPLGIDFTRHTLLVGLTRQFSSRLSGALHYTFSQYSEPSSGNLNNFTANGVFAMINYKL
jgi:hypothetical protein